MSRNRRRRRRRSNGCLKCLTVFVVIIVLFAGVLTGGAFFAWNQYAQPVVGISFTEAVGVIGTLYSGKASKVVTNPYKAEDLDSFYVDLRQSLFLKDSVNIKDSFSAIVSDLLAKKDETNVETVVEETGTETGTEEKKPFTTGNPAIDQLLAELEFDFSSLDTYKNEEETPRLLEISDKQLAAFLDDTVSSLLKSDAISQQVNSMTESLGMQLDLSKIVEIPQVIIKNEDALLDPINTGVTLTVALNLKDTVKSFLSSKSSALAIIGNIFPKTIYATITIYPNNTEKAAKIVINAASTEKMDVILKIADTALQGSGKGSVNDILITVNQKAIEAIEKVQALVPVSFVDSGSVELKPIKALMNMLKVTEISETQFLTMIRDVRLPVFDEIATQLGYPEGTTYEQINTLIDKKIGDLIIELEDKYAIEQGYLQKETLYSQLTKIDSVDGSDCLKNHIEPDRLPLADASYVAADHKVPVAYQAFAGIINGYLKENPINSGSMNITFKVINMYYDASDIKTMSIVIEVNLLDALAGSMDKEDIVYKLTSQLIPKSLYITANIELVEAGVTTLSINGKTVAETEDHLNTMVSICTSLGMSADSLQYSELSTKIGDSVRNGLTNVGEKMGAELVFYEEQVLLPNIYEVLAGIVFKDVAEKLTPEEIYLLMHDLSAEMPKNFTAASEDLGFAPEMTVEDYQSALDTNVNTFISTFTTKYAITNLDKDENPIITKDNVYNKLMNFSNDSALINSIKLANLPEADTYNYVEHKVDTAYLALTSILNNYLKNETAVEEGKLDSSKYSLVNIQYDDVDSIIKLKIQVKLSEYINLNKDSSMYDLAMQILPEDIFMDVQVSLIETEVINGETINKSNICIIGLQQAESDLFMQRIITFGKALGANMDALSIESLKKTLSTNVVKGLDNIKEKLGVEIIFNSDKCLIPSIYEILANKILYSANVGDKNLSDQEVFYVFKGLKDIPEEYKTSNKSEDYTNLTKEVNDKYCINETKKLTAPSSETDLSIINQLTNIANSYNDAIDGTALKNAWNKAIEGKDESLKKSILEEKFRPCLSEGDIAKLFADNISVTSNGLENLQIDQVYVKDSNTFIIIFTCDYQGSSTATNNYAGLVPKFVIKAELNLNNISSSASCCSITINNLSTDADGELADFELMVNRLSKPTTVDETFSVANTNSQCDALIKDKLQNMLSNLNMTLVPQSGEGETKVDAKIYLSSIYETACNKIKKESDTFTAVDLADTISALYNNIGTTAQSGFDIDDTDGSSDKMGSPTIIYNASLPTGVTHEVTARNLGAVILEKGLGSLETTFGAGAVSLNQVAIINTAEASIVSSLTASFARSKLFDEKTGEYAVITIDLNTENTTFKSTLLPAKINVTALVGLKSATKGVSIVYNDLSATEMNVLAALANNNAFKASEAATTIETYVNGLVLISVVEPAINLTLKNIIDSNLGTVTSSIEGGKVCGKVAIKYSLI